MREQIRDRERLRHILAAIERVKRYVQGKTFEDMLADDMMYYAVVKNIEMIGEAANMLTHDFQSAHPETPWKMVRGMRNYIVHEYFPKSLQNAKENLIGVLENKTELFILHKV